MLEAAVLCLAMNMYHEARGDGFEGMLAVAEVTMNRVHDDRFPNTVCEVVTQGPTDDRGNPNINQCQFSWYCDGKSDRMTDDFWRFAAEELAVDVLTGLQTNYTQGATHYHATYVNPWWASTKTYQTTIGSHIFYTWD